MAFVQLTGDRGRLTLSLDEWSANRKLTHYRRSASVPRGVYPEAPRGVYPKKRPCLASGLYSGDTTSTPAAPLSESSPRQTRESRPCTQPPPRCDSRADLSR